MGELGSHIGHVTKIYIHFGFHKTGTTSFQNYCMTNSELLYDAGFAYYTGAYNPENHIELALSSLRDPLDVPVKRKFPRLSKDKVHAETKESINDFLHESRGKSAIFSNEALSFIRTNDEIDSLLRLFPEEVDIIPVLCLRNINEWRNSFEQQLKKMDFNPKCGDFNSYFEINNWLLDHEKLCELVKSRFSRYIFIEYSENMVKLMLDKIDSNIGYTGEIRLNGRKKASIGRRVRRFIKFLISKVVGLSRHR